MRERAAAKVNLCLLVGPLRSDGRHELVSVMVPITIFDELEMRDGERDEVICPGVEGPEEENLASRALASFRRETGWDAPALRLAIAKRVPVAAGLGSDVPALVEPRAVLVRGGGERVEPVTVGPLALLVLPSPARLSTAAVYAQADRLRAPRSTAELAALDPLAMTSVNDLQDAAISLEPTIAPALAAVRDAGASHAMVCGSGPTVVGLFATASAAEDAQTRLRESGRDALVAVSYGD